MAAPTKNEGWQRTLTPETRQAMATMATATESKTQQSEPKPERKLQRARVDDKFKIFSTTAKPQLADEDYAFLDMPRRHAHITRFQDDEVYVQVLQNLRIDDVFLMQPTCYPLDTHLMELLIMIDALKHDSD